MTPSDYAAWYGATAATVAIAWDFFKWRKSRNNLSVEISYKQIVLFPNSSMDESVRIPVSISNRGDQATTITAVELYSFPSILHRYLPWSKGRKIQALGNLSGELDPGKIWGCIIESYSSAVNPTVGVYYVAIKHATSSRPFWVKLSFPISS